MLLYSGNGNLKTNPGPCWTNNVDMLLGLFDAVGITVPSACRTSCTEPSVFEGTALILLLAGVGKGVLRALPYDQACRDGVETKEGAEWTNGLSLPLSSNSLSSLARTAKESTDLRRVLKWAWKTKPPFCCFGGRVSGFGSRRVATERQ